MACDSFMKAARNGDMKSVMQLISEGTDVNIVDKLNRSALHLASWAGKPEMVKLLISLGYSMSHHVWYYLNPI